MHVTPPVLDLQKYLDQGVRVKLQGGREVHGVLKGFDPLVNVVLDECIEFIRGKSGCVAWFGFGFGFGLVWFGLVWFGFCLIWVWFGLVLVLV